MIAVLVCASWEIDLLSSPENNPFLIVPVDYEELLSYYTQRGFRVIACATKMVPFLSSTKAQGMKRCDAESELEFVGFIIFENKLKPLTTATIAQLNNAAIRNVMCTGDNILTAISVARECGMIDRTAHCFVPHFWEGISGIQYLESGANCFTAVKVMPKTLTRV